MDDAIDDAAVAEDRRLGYPSRHDWNWMPTLGDNYGDWLDAAYPMINRLARERDEARAEVERLTGAIRESLAYDTYGMAGGAQIPLRALNIG